MAAFHLIIYGRFWVITEDVSGTGTRQKLAFDKDNIGGMSFNHSAELFQGFSSRYHPNVIFKRDDLADSGAIDRLRVRKNKSDRIRLNGAG
jgi:hypothetical protein